MQTSNKETAIKAILTVVQDILYDSLEGNEGAINYLSEGKLNTAIGEVLYLNRTLEDALKLYSTILVLHRIK